MCRRASPRKRLFAQVLQFSNGPTSSERLNVFVHNIFLNSYRKEDQVLRRANDTPTADMGRNSFPKIQIENNPVCMKTIKENILPTVLRKEKSLMVHEYTM